MDINNLNGKQLHAFRKALISAFPDKEKLKQMVGDEMNENLDEIAGGNNLQDITFDLIKDKSSKGELNELLNAALAKRPKNKALKDFAQSFGYPINQKNHSPNHYPKTGENDSSSLPYSDEYRDFNKEEIVYAFSIILMILVLLLLPLYILTRIQENEKSHKDITSLNNHTEIEKPTKLLLR